MSKQQKLEMTEEVRRIFAALGGGSGLVQLHARDLTNYQDGISFLVGDDSRGRGALVLIRPERGRYILTIKELFNGRVKEFSVPLANLGGVLWDQLVEAADT